MSETDLELLARYTRQNAEDAFTEIVRRHLDLVHSAALRQVRSPQLAEEVAQAAFIKLARQARQLAAGTILTAWLYQVTRREAIDVVRREARRQSREQIATEMNALNVPTADWTHIEPLLDEAMAALDDPDRAAVLLRYFENKSLREVGAILGTSDDAAQKRVRRAVEHLREFFARRGVPVGASGLVAVLSAHAVQAAPVGLVVTISAAAALAGTTLAASSTATSTAALAKAIAMTALQKTFLAATVAVLAGAGIYETRQVSRARAQVQTLRQQQAESVQQLQIERATATRQLATLRDDNQRLNRNPAELLRLRGEVGRLRRERAAGPAEAPGEKPAKNNAELNPVASPAQWTDPGKFLSKEQLSDVGTGTPAQAMKTYLWMLSQPNPERLPEVLSGFSTNRAGRLAGEFKSYLDDAKGVFFNGIGTATNASVARAVVSLTVIQSDNTEFSKLVKLKLDGQNWKVISDVWTLLKAMHSSDLLSDDEIGYQPPEPSNP